MNKKILNIYKDEDKRDEFSLDLEIEEDGSLSLTNIALYDSSYNNFTKEQAIQIRDFLNKNYPQKKRKNNARQSK